MKAKAPFFKFIVRLEHTLYVGSIESERYAYTPEHAARLATASNYANHVVVSVRRAT